MRLDQINDLLNPDLARRLHQHATGEMGYPADLLPVLYRQVHLQG